MCACTRAAAYAGAPPSNISVISAQYLPQQYRLRWITHPPSWVILLILPLHYPHNAGCDSYALNVFVLTLSWHGLRINDQQDYMGVYACCVIWTCLCGSVFKEVYQDLLKSDNWESHCCGSLRNIRPITLLLQIFIIFSHGYYSSSSPCVIDFNSVFMICVALSCGNHAEIWHTKHLLGLQQEKITQAATRIKERKPLTMVVLRKKVDVASPSRGERAEIVDKH